MKEFVWTLYENNRLRQRLYRLGDGLSPKGKVLVQAALSNFNQDLARGLAGLIKYAVKTRRQGAKLTPIRLSIGGDDPDFIIDYQIVDDEPPPTAA
jgi:hypothetical protein